MDALRPTPANLIRQAHSILAQRQAEERTPKVERPAINETEDSFAARLAPLVCGSRPVFGVVPYDFATLPGIRRVELSPKHWQVLHPSRRCRYRVLKGGRGAAKSRSIAIDFILLALTTKALFLCCREIQKSIKESVHRLLANCIEDLGLLAYFDIGVQTITAHNGSEFIFEGLWANTQRIKSLEGVTYCWVEEAAMISSKSWEDLIPTIRKPGSQIFINYNPDAADAPTHVMFGGDSVRSDAVVEHVTYADNPWFPPELERERQYLASVDADAHAHVWLGECRTHSDAQILKGKVTVEEFTPAAGWDGPYLGLDFGFSQDPTAAVRCWVHERTLYIEFEAYQVGCDIDRTPALLDQIPDARKYTMRADCARPESISYLQRYGYPNVVAATKWSGSVEDGVAHLRSYESVVIHPRCAHAIEEARLYAFKVDRLSGDVLPDIVDRHNHVMDALRYALAPLIQQAGVGILQYYQGLQSAETTAKADLIKQPGTTVTELVSPWHQENPLWGPK